MWPEFPSWSFSSTTHGCHSHTSLFTMEPKKKKKISEISEENKMYCYLFALANVKSVSPSGSAVWFYCGSTQNPQLSDWTRWWEGSKIITQRGVDVSGFCVAHASQRPASIIEGLVGRSLYRIVMKTLHSLAAKLFASSFLRFIIAE